MQQILNDIAAEMALETDRGKVADYIPQLAHVDPNQFGIAVATPDGQVYVAGDASTLFSIQSISKVFTLTIGLGKLGDAIWTHVGREPSGDPFNSITVLEFESGRPRNPFINAGAIAVVDAIMMGHEPKETLGEILRFVHFIADDDSIRFDHKVAASEMDHRDRNAALAHFMKSFGHIKHDVDKVLGVYFHQCAIAMSCEQLARAGLFLVSNGVNQHTGIRVINAQQSRRINSLMMMCGHYDGAGEFAYRVGLPGKSGVGGGILTIAPGKGSIAVWSPGLDHVGNSKLGSKALELLVQKTGWSVFSN
ncbi:MULTISPECIES: glutaminase [Psychrobacter]|uniref:Glutaminase n=1 Tax=Psychrobacter cryohalolentis (strain ATCC BAA-1226 / DSM 17306 / VKM B-2378 / K5) TaxID=335284 RepID=GLSA_PSYCK|nr:MULTISPECIES: glutaminase [Psychrobacter]Q1QB42.1 RecName: Full=Glutaminase [Psychrobacter cryohalolentis K5]ABE75111.1 Glutaminase [Psychrobacter cryohalolentis K5]ASE25312.1 glutaminase [Psychrobacter cryohalolentis]KAA0929239.1 glutaminase [Psychrobacter sp. ANT_H56B]KAA0939453.1 glutaminase [Psychrobacter sp. ANT_H59]WAI87768.1 Thermolabile glutaminase [Psychrobacter sp. SC65A.3]|tara:strand:+ start:172 stop:1092 length:921 start_codon:yes stop_codon:yes gene_type:complete